VYLDSDALLLNLTSGLDQNLEKKIPGVNYNRPAQAAK